MTSARLRFALEQLTSGDWQLFERFCSEFLVPEFPGFRTTATPSGDRGRDGEVFTLDSVAHTGFQFSVTSDWRTKIRSTFRTLIDNGIVYQRLIYCTSQQIGSLADGLKGELWDEQSILLDVRDREWFCERELTSPEREVSSAELVERVVTPIVNSRGIAKVAGSPLSSGEAKVALVHLALNAEDRAGDRNLTKTSFDALVQSVLVDTSQENLLTEAEIIDRVRALAPHGADSQVAALTKSALDRLSRKHGPVKHHSSHGGYHLSYEATEAWKEDAAAYILEQQSLEEDLAAAAYGYVEILDSDAEQLKAESKTLRIALEAVMFRSGESFAAAVEGGDPARVSVDEMVEQVTALGLPLKLHPTQAVRAILEVISDPAEATRRHLTRVLDAYTLLAFLQQTPDVQKAMSRVFDNAKVWLDTSAVLPLVAETLIDDPSERLQTTLLNSATSSGLSLFVTDGVVEEIHYHLERCISYLRQGNGRYGPPPFLYAAYMLSGRDERQFPKWAEDIRGEIDPDRDIEEYLAEKFNIRLNDLAEFAEKADQTLRAATMELFSKRRSRSYDGQADRTQKVIDRLAIHDMESVVGIIELRRNAKPALGHEVWWLTLDKTAFRLSSWLRRQMGREAPDTPALSPDYLSQLLRLGPLRRNLDSDEVRRLPLIIDVTRLETVPPKLIEIARSTRESMEGLDERRIRREVRDALHKARTELRRSHDYGQAAESSVAERLRVQRS
ncbi:hypothetical protein EFN10_07310 [Propionibacterium freudenreichii]|uniref:hypothetical protein n=1 Tax=Propionibacterium freudenreichii TaxID=1744 RepID=UPI0021A7FB9F|nr:hypothetical protein [Propionibacterium freudenreichii]MCT2995932.1 hypothetical protein [Propionibacterium freudenreichii]MDK9626095.1 hypothetical protein [Propionibacterium freudenreichii]